MTIIANPNGAFLNVSDFTTGRDDDGNPIVLGNQCIEGWQAGATILQGQALMFTAPTTTAPITVEPMTAAVTAADSWRFAGVAMEDASSGDQVRVCRSGPVEILFDTAATPAAYDLLEAPGTTTGDFDVAGAAADNGVYVGWVLGGEIGTEDKCLAMIGQPLVRFEAGA